MVKMLNRSALSVLPKQPFVDWANSLPDEDPLCQKMSLEEHRAEGTIYLVDECASEEELEVLISENWQAIFEMELSSWDEWGEHHPATINRALFDQWFELSFQSAVLDIAKHPLQLAELGEE